MEKFDLFDKNRVPTGEVVERFMSVEDGRFIQVVHVAIFNSKGQMLIQQRQNTKKSNPNMWDISVGGGVLSGELSFQGASRELFEELGINYDFSQTRPSCTINFDIGFDDFYILKKDVSIDELILQTEEVQNVMWANKQQIFEMIDRKEFIGYRKDFIGLLFDFNRKPYDVWY